MQPFILFLMITALFNSCVHTVDHSYKGERNSKGGRELCVCEREQADQQYIIILSYSLFCMLIVKQHEPVHMHT